MYKYTIYIQLLVSILVNNDEQIIQLINLH